MPSFTRLSCYNIKTHRKPWHLGIYTAYFNWKLFVAITIDLHAVVWNNTESLSILHPVFPSGSTWQNYTMVLWPGNWHGYNPLILFKFPLLILICLHACVFIKFYTILSSDQAHISATRVKILNIPTPQGCPFKPHPPPSCPTPPPAPSPQPMHQWFTHF